MHVQLVDLTIVGPIYAVPASYLCIPHPTTKEQNEQRKFENDVFLRIFSKTKLIEDAPMIPKQRPFFLKPELWDQGLWGAV